MGTLCQVGAPWPRKGSSKMKIAFVYQYYQTTNEPGHSVVFELTQFLADQGHEVFVVSGETGYMRRDQQERPSWFKRLVRKEKVGKVNVVRTYTYTGIYRSYFARFLSFLSFTLSSPLGLFALPKVDVIVGSSPPLFPVFSAFLVATLKRTPFVVEVRDLWPDSAIQMGLLHSKLGIQLMRWIERILYNHAKKIVVLTKGIQTDITRRGWPAEKIAFISCGINPSFMRPDEAARARVRQENGWQDQFVVMYFGALGEANNIPVILRAAIRLKDEAGIRFVLVGDGMKRLEIAEACERQGLTNIQMLAPVPKHEAPAMINAADVCLVTLKDIKLFEGAIPTKLVDYIACGKTVLIGARGEAADIGTESGCGYAFEPNDDEALAAHILRIRADAAAFHDKATREGPAYAQRMFLATDKMRDMLNVLLEAQKKKA